MPCNWRLLTGGLFLQEANRLLPNVAHTLCLAAKAWSDACYLDEIQGPFRERLTMQDRHEVNKKAIEHAKQASPALTYTLLLVSLFWEGVYLAKLALHRARCCREVGIFCQKIQSMRDSAWMTCRPLWWRLTRRCRIRLPASAWGGLRSSQTTEQRCNELSGLRGFDNKSLLKYMHLHI